MKKYTLEIAIEICKEIEQKLVPLGYHSALGGSCLYRGESQKDIDIIIYPHDVKKQKPPVYIIRELGMNTKTYQSQGQGLIGNITPSTTDKIVFVCYGRFESAGEDDVRIDLFFLV